MDSKRPRYIPEDINIEELLLYFPEGGCRVEFRGMHKRNSYYDIENVREDKRSKSLHVTAGRNSLYHVLPEYMFHPFDRFDSLNNEEERKRFSSEHDQQDQEIDNAQRFFAPIDLLLLQQKMKIREKSRWYTERNQILFDVLADELTEKQKNNRFVSQAIHFLPSCKYIRGNKTLLTLLLRKLFLDEGIKTDIHRYSKEFCDLEPRYDESLGAVLDTCYVGNVFYENVAIYDIHYWSDDECNEDFLKFLDKVEEFRQFVQDYMMSVEELLYFNISTDGDPVVLDEDSHYYMNYNTNI